MNKMKIETIETNMKNNINEDGFLRKDLIT